MAVSHCSGFTSDGELHGAAEAAAVVGLFGMHVLGGASVVYDCHACWSFQLRIAAATCTPGGDKRAARGAVVFGAAKVANTEAASRCVSLAPRPSYCSFVLPVQIGICAMFPTRCACRTVRTSITNDMLLWILSGEHRGGDLHAR